MIHKDEMKVILLACSSACVRPFLDNGDVPYVYMSVYLIDGLLFDVLCVIRGRFFCVLGLYVSVYT